HDHAALEGGLSPAGEIPRPHRRGETLPAAVRRPDRERGEPAGVPGPEPDPFLDPAVPRRPGLPRVRDPDPPAGLRRGKRPAVHHVPQLPGPETLPEDSARTIPQAPRGRRFRAGL